MRESHAVQLTKVVSKVGGEDLVDRRILLYRSNHFHVLITPCALRRGESADVDFLSVGGSEHCLAICGFLRYTTYNTDVLAYICTDGGGVDAWGSELVHDETVVVPANSLLNTSRFSKKFFMHPFISQKLISVKMS